MFGHDNNQDLHQDEVPRTDVSGAIPAPITDEQTVTGAPTLTDPSNLSSTNSSLDGSTTSTLQTGESTVSSTTPPQPNVEDLLTIKQNALQALTPLVSHLEQTPEEKFKTTMMMIQASDDQSLVNEAYETAQKISDDKARAQALLDIVNEINYFTQHK